MAYLSEIIIAAQVYGQNANEYILVLYTWIYLDIELRENIDKSSINTTITIFMNILRRK